ncbi:hypothetical protein QTP88_016679 [Uroleucon formosanum]
MCTKNPSKLLQSQLELNDLNVCRQDVMTTQDVNAIHKSTVGLASEFRDKVSEIGRALKHLFGLPYIPPSEVLDFFTDDLMTIKPNDDKIDKVFDYIFENYIMPDSRFPPEM